jgi:GntR family transcriptional repressor for pyruvate dehydrogenase complex
MPTRSEPLKRANLPVSIAERIRRQIAQGQLKAGAQLPGHRELATLYSVSVGSVREAISMLVSEGLVTTRAGRGTFVVASDDSLRMWSDRPLDRDEVEELVEAREALETHIAALAAERATPAQLAQLERAVEGMQADLSDATLFLEADIAFHMALADAAGNRFLLQALTSIHSMLRRDLQLSVEVGLRRHGNLGFAVARHRAVVDAIAAKDPVAARAAMNEIVIGNRAFVLGLYSPPDPGERDR